MPNVRPIIRPLARDISRSIVHGSAFNPLSLFANGEQGAWYDPSDLTTLYQDAAGTTPVTAGGDPVGLMLDKSGNGNHASQSVAASRPIYPGLNYDGVDGFVNLPTIPFSGAATIFLLMRSSTSGLQIIVGSKAPAFNYLVATALNNTTSAVNTGFGSVTYYKDGAEITGTINRDRLYREFCDGQWHILEIDSSNIYQNIQLSGMNGTTFVYDGDIASVVLIAGVPTLTDRQNVRNYLAQMAGITL